jgi:5-formyltetrahydrofolate cyclo-ligase
VKKIATPLIFREWRPGDVLEDAPFGTRIPSDAAKELTPEIVIVPLLAFDSEGYRLGYGGGYYDRTLDLLRRKGDCIAVGFAYSGQEWAGVPRERHDERLDWIVTEDGARRIE